MVDLNVPRIIYIRNESGFPVACLAYSRVAPNRLEFGLSCHNPCDKFDRKLARAIAEGRFKARPFVFEFDNDLAPLRDVLHDLMIVLSGTDCSRGLLTGGRGAPLAQIYGNQLLIPIRVQRAALNYLNYNKPSRH